MDWKQQLEEKFSGKNMRQDLAYLVVGKRKGWQTTSILPSLITLPLLQRHSASLFWI